MVKFKDDDFGLFVNLANPKKRYYYAEKVINDCVIEVMTNDFKINYKIEIKRKDSLIAKGSSKYISGLNLDINNFISLNTL